MQCPVLILKFISVGCRFTCKHGDCRIDGKNGHESSHFLGEATILSMIPNILKCASIALVFSCVYGFAGQTEGDSTPLGKKIDIFGSGAIEAGEIEDGHYGGNVNAEIQHLWIGHAYADLGVRAKLNEHFSTLISLESRIWYNTSPLNAVRDNSTFGSPMQNVDINITNAEGILSFGSRGIFDLMFGIGRFEYKYDPQSQDLGEYMFRTGCYPAYIETNFDLSLARLNGVIASLKLFDFLRQDLIMNTMSDIEPFYNFNLTYIVDASIGKVFDVGAGVQFEDLISVDQQNDMRTSVHNYLTNGYLSAPGDTGYYTFQGTKLMFRFMFDPKRFFDVHLLGENDGQLYFETAVLGVENYPRSNAIDTNNLCNIFGYDKIFQKMPVMFGVNIPTFRQLDILSVEGEWFGSRYPDNYKSYLDGLSSTPSNPSANENYYDYTHDDWKWAIYGKKTIFGGLSFIGLVGRDHMRTETYIKLYQDYEEALIKNSAWYWMLKVKYSF